MALITAIEARQKIKKGEFETTSDYQSRLSGSEQRPFIGGIAKHSQIAFIFNDKKAEPFSYDPDTEQMTITLQPNQFPCGRYDTDLLIDSTFKINKKYAAQNAMGANLVVTQSLATATCLSYIGFKSFRFEVPRKQAADVKYSSRLLFIGTLYEPYVSSTSSYTKPTFNSPYELVRESKFINLKLTNVWVFNPKSGEVLFKTEINQ